ncbi:MAG: DUF933 domain-containing protein, partial [Proteobacteria bacterium]|nr:DUF933 domain-containing protein [Pseudomonadota bacterium]
MTIMKVGFIGKRGSGKTTLYEAVSGLDMLNQPSGGLVNIAKVRVKDPKIDKLSEIFKPKKTTYADFDLVDYNRAHDASDAPLGSPNLIARYRELDAIVIVLGVIDDPAFIASELDDICVEMNLSDVMILEAKIQRMKKGAYDKQEMALYENILAKLETNGSLGRRSFTKDEMRYLSAYQLFALKPIMIAINVTEGLLSTSISSIDLGKNKLPCILISAEIEKELNSLGDDEKKEFLKDLNLSEGISDRFISMLYDTLDLISFYTVGEDEVRAWSITRGDTALT